jgi:hypothetical protein
MSAGADKWGCRTTLDATPRTAYGRFAEMVLRKRDAELAIALGASRSTLAAGAEIL